MELDLTGLLISVSTILAGIITKTLIPWLKTVINLNKQKHINYWINSAVEWAQLEFEGTGRGLEKKKQAEKFLKQKNLGIDNDEIEKLVKAAVYKLKEGIF